MNGFHGGISDDICDTCGGSTADDFSWSHCTCDNDKSTSTDPWTKVWTQAEIEESGGRVMPFNTNGVKVILP